MSPLKPASCSMTEADEIMVTSPPRSGGATNLNINLFSDNQDPHSVDDTFLFRSLTLTSSSSLGSRPIHRRKRPGDFFTAGRPGTLYEDSDEEMFQSPRSSPNSYQTIDGRTVASKNPFSPYTPMEENMVMSPIQKHLRNVPNFPVYLRQTSSKAVNLLQRSSPYQESYDVPPQNDDLYASNASSLAISHDHDMYPIPERSAQKVRRLHENDVTSVRRFNIESLHINTNLPRQHSEEISPTDVCNFPPATPLKKSRQASFRFTSPETPGIDSKHRIRTLYDDDDSELLDQSSLPETRSRFALDFHVIGQLGNGSFGTVYKCLSRLDGCLYAVKETKRKAKGILDRDRMLKEVSVT
jgi:hypothetical protein